ncbi:MULTISPECIES: HAMP domain-containing sensor histidine kinase [unclassified Spirosoma]|uniref:sensor histidine kinase n=1 Tax=unclassified Spirosoma TaxID=2621999 RepID=UPI00095946AA|nr:MULTISPECIES: HAMP domain-containing sensor histidine kinase [unclassified Spirosoma]MBN8825796.1 HAMP domain-containing histidine kinase [Spirosoma sp.]OJW74388.1 MAG: two-component sensor histidine kinase [Spirosoma sp. 48-14]
MTIRNRIALQFSLIVASILIFFSILIYWVSATYRQEEFYERLKNKARTTVRFLIEVKEVDRELLKIIDRNTLTALFDEKVLIFDGQNHLIYSSVDDQVIYYRSTFLSEVRHKKEIETHSGPNELVGLLYQQNGRDLVVLASAYDQFGKSKLENLKLTLGWGLLVGLSITIGLGIFFAGQSLQPISQINQQVSTITARNLQQRLDEGNRQDEIARLAMNFNDVLYRLEQAFEQQRSFVSHASHELRTPLAALKSEIQLGLRRPLTVDEHQDILTNLLSDTDRLIGLTNGLLFLARALETSNQVTRQPIRIDDVIFLAKDELVSAKPHYQISVDYDNIPETETETLIEGNEELLKLVFVNLFDNACKYSANQTAQVRIGTDSHLCRITVRDTGIGISEQDIAHIFEPFYRASNALDYQGFGIGLSICAKLIELHQGTLAVESKVEEGSTFTISLPHL